MSLTNLVQHQAHVCTAQSYPPKEWQYNGPAWVSTLHLVCVHAITRILTIINSRHMRSEGYSSLFVRLSLHCCPQSSFKCYLRSCARYICCVLKIPIV